MEPIEAINPIDFRVVDNDTVTIYDIDNQGLLVQSRIMPADTKLTENQTRVPLPEHEPGKFGFADGSRPQFDDKTQTWHPYKEPVEPSPEMQAINQIGLQVAKLMVGGKSNG